LKVIALVEDRQKDGLMTVLFGCTLAEALDEEKSRKITGLNSPHGHRISFDEE